MGMSIRNRVNFNRKRINIRKYISIRNSMILTLSIFIIFFITAITGKILLDKKVKNSTIIYREEANNLDEVQNTEELALGDKETVIENNLNENTNKIEEVKAPEDNGQVNINLLGEIMMGGNVTEKLNYTYTSAFKEIYSLARSSDFTYANLSTNITNLDKIENAKSKYLVTKEIVNGLNAIGIDALSIASDHMVDFTEDIFKSTTNILEKNNIFVAGRENTPVYLEKGDKKIAIISTNSVIIGTSKIYTKNEISIYNDENLKKNILEAKQVANIVIVDVHWGREYIYGVTDQMKNIAMSAIDYGADLVIGSHALGVYPIVKYKDKPIIYSTGYLISDSDYTVAKESFIFNLNISKESKIDSITMTPIYIDDNKSVKLYNDYDINKSTEYIKQFNNWQLDNSLDSKIQDSKIIIKF